MVLEQFMNAHSDWPIQLRQQFHIDSKQDGEYWLVKYDLLNADFSLPIVREARGSIFTCENGIWKCVCHALDAFRNFGEPCAQTNLIDWAQGVDVQEKIDGSLVKIWFHNGWHVSTNGTIDANKALVGNSGISFLDLFLRIAHLRLEDFPNTFDPNYTYWFELVAPQFNKIVVRYKENGIYFLGARDMRDHEEVVFAPQGNWYKLPRHFTYNSLEECVMAAHGMGDDEEGYVCVARQKLNGSFLRIKVKGDEYLKLHHLRGNSALTVKKVVEMWQEGSLDDFIAYFPEYYEFTHQILAIVQKEIEICDAAFTVLSNYPNVEDRKTLASYACKYLPFIRNFIFARYDNKVDCARTYFSRMRPRSFAAIIEPQLDIKEIGIDEEI